MARARERFLSICIDAPGRPVIGAKLAAEAQIFPKNRPPSKMEHRLKRIAADLAQ
jgi:hypothetical protein